MEQFTGRLGNNALIVENQSSQFVENHALMPFALKGIVLLAVGVQDLTEPCLLDPMQSGGDLGDCRTGA